MPSFPIFQVDAFADAPFGGNPAAVCPLPEWLPDVTMQAIAAENNVSETAFFVASGADGADFHLRWFTPEVEVPLCGHATLASGFVLLEHQGYPGPKVTFSTRSGQLSVERRDAFYWVDLPSQPPQAIEMVPGEVALGLGAAPLEILATANKYFAVYSDAATVADLAPDMSVLGRLSGKGVVATAPGGPDGADFVSRFFTPACGIPEDPVTGSAHCLLVPYWARRTGRNRLLALQISARRGRLQAELKGERVALGGTVHLYLRGEIFLA